MSSDSFTFIVRIPDKDPVRHDLEGEAKTLGRGPDNDIQVLVSEVSVKHARLEPSESGYKIVDPGSTNGTKVNGQAVGEGGAELAGKHKIVLGETTPAYFVPTSELESSSVEDVIQSIESASQAAPGTAPVAQAAPAQATSAQPAPAAAQAPSDGATTVKLDQVQPSAPGGGPAKPPPAAPAPGGAKPPPAAPGGAKPSSAQRSAPKPAEPEQQEEGDSAGAKPVAPVPMKKPGEEGGAPKPPPAPGGAKPPPPPKPQE